MHSHPIHDIHALVDLCDEADRSGNKDAIRAALELAEDMHEESNYTARLDETINYLERRLRDLE